jgi:uncharacterized membrane protein
MTPTDVAANDRRWQLALIATAVIAATIFVVLPGSIEGKSLAALHGLCAQQPTHSLYFGDQRLPFDARMTGIYGGFLTTALYLLTRGRWRFGGVPTIAVAALLALFVTVLAVDGLNSTLRDIGAWHAYTPRNEFRLVTGTLTGTSLAAFLWMLVAQVGFASRARVHASAIAGPGDLGLLLLAHCAAIFTILSGWPVLRLPLTFLLLIAAVAVVTGLTLAFVLLLGRREARAVTTADLAGPATVALAIALVTIMALGGGRFALEWWLGIEAATMGVR